MVAIATEETLYVLRFNRQAYLEAVSAGTIQNDGVEDAFEVIADLNEKYALPSFELISVYALQNG